MNDDCLKGRSISGKLKFSKFIVYNYEYLRLICQTMDYETIAPSRELKTCVRHYWFIEQREGPDCLRSFKLMADGFLNLIFQYDSNFQDHDNNDASYPSLILTGHTGHVKNVLTRQHFGVCGIAFYPTAIPQLFQAQSAELSDEVIDGTHLFNNNIRGLQDYIAGGKNNQERAHLFNTFLLKKLDNRRHSPIIEYALQRIMERQGMLNIGRLAEELRLSRRQLERLFSQHIGFSPKYYSRIIRFQSTLSHPEASITDIAFSYGYADQAHFIRDFHEFSGMSPKHYFKGSREAAENFVELRY